MGVEHQFMSKELKALREKTGLYLQKEGREVN